jgi:hypothetical protein
VSRAESDLGPLGQMPVTIALCSDTARVVLPHLYTLGVRGGRSVQAIEASAGDVRAMLLRGACGLVLYEPQDDPRLASRVLSEDRYLFVQPLSRRARCGAVGRAELAGAA